MTLADYLKPDLYKRAIQQGLEKRLAEGIEKGRTETARNMFVKGVNIGFIVSVTGLLQDRYRKANELVRN